MTLLCDLRGIVRYVSPLCPTGRHDITQLREILPFLEKQLDLNDVLLFDKAYKEIQEDFENNVVFVKYTKPPNSFLCEELRVTNSEMEKILSLIEHSIEDVKSRFGIMKN
jgi:hypothetical protein